MSKLEDLLAETSRLDIPCRTRPIRAYVEIMDLTAAKTLLEGGKKLKMEIARAGSVEIRTGRHLPDCFGCFRYEFQD